MLTRIDCAHLLTADEHQPYVPAAAVLVRGDAIAWAGPGAQCPATREQAAKAGYATWCCSVLAPLPGLLRPAGAKERQTYIIFFRGGYT